MSEVWGAPPAALDHGDAAESLDARDFLGIVAANPNGLGERAARVRSAAT